MRKLSVKSILTSLFDTFLDHFIAERFPLTNIVKCDSIEVVEELRA